MQQVDLRKRAITARDGEAIFGIEDTGSHACYMIYGVLRPGEKDRRVCPGPGHEEMLVAVKGDFTVTGDFLGGLREGEAFHLAGYQACYLENSGQQEAVYVISGGHSGVRHHTAASTVD